MEQEMQFGLPGSNKTRTTKEERFPNNAVMILSPREDQNKRTKIEFNAAAIKALSLTEGDNNQVAFSNSNGEFFIINANDFDSGHNLSTSKKGVISNKTYWEALKSKFNSKDEDELLIELKATERVFNGLTVFTLVRYHDLRTIPTETKYISPTEAVNEELETTIDSGNDMLADIDTDTLRDMEVVGEEQITNEN